MKYFIAPVLAALLFAASGGGVADAAEPAAKGLEPGPVFVDSTEILYLESYPVQVNLLVTGSLPTPCHSTVYEVRDSSDSVDVLLWSEADLGALCAQVLEAFELVIPLGSYESADVPVFLNGEQVGRIEIGTSGSKPTLQAAGWSFGFCGGYCAADMVIEGADLSLSGSSRSGEAPLYTNQGTLTADGQATLQAALAELDGAPLDVVYGCPDCADGGAAYLELVRDGRPERIEMEFGNPPAALADLYMISASLMSALETCTSNPLVDVSDDCAAYEAT